MFKTAMSVLSEFYYCPNPSSEMVKFEMPIYARSLLEMPIYARSPLLRPDIIFVRTGATGGRVKFLSTAQSFEQTTQIMNKIFTHTVKFLYKMCNKWSNLRIFSQNV